MKPRIPVVILSNHDPAHSSFYSFVSLPCNPEDEVGSIIPTIQSYLEGLRGELRGAKSFSFFQLRNGIRRSEISEFKGRVEGMDWSVDVDKMARWIDPKESLEIFRPSIIEPSHDVENRLIQMLVVGVQMEHFRSGLPWAFSQGLRDHKKFHALFWGKKVEEKNMGIPDSGFSLAEDEHSMVSPTTLHFFEIPEGFYSFSKRIMVRNEYKTCYDFLVSHAETGGGVVVTGQPGIGKSFFLVYCLIRRLSEGLPTVFSLRSHEEIYYHNTLGVEVYSPAHSPDSISYGTWALIDADYELILPSKDVCGPGFGRRFFVVQTTSPDERRFEEWAKQRHALRFCMQPWTWDEIWAGSHLQNEGVKPLLQAETLRDVFDRYGSSARTAYTLCDPDHRTLYESKISRAISGLTLDDLQMLLGTGGTTTLGLSDELVIVLPSAIRGAGISRIEIASKYIFKCLVDHFADKLETFTSIVIRMLKDEAPTAPTRGILHEAAIHRLFLDPKRHLDDKDVMELQLIPMKKTAGYPKNLYFEASTEQELATLVVQKRSAVSFDKKFLPTGLFESNYYMPQATINASFDAFIIWEKALFVFQTTTAKHDIQVEGLDLLEKISRPLESQVNRPWKFVCVVPESENVRLVVSQIDEERFKGQIEFYTLEIDSTMLLPEYMF